MAHPEVVSGHEFGGMPFNLVPLQPQLLWLLHCGLVSPGALDG